MRISHSPQTHPPISTPNPKPALPHDMDTSNTAAPRFGHGGYESGPSFFESLPGFMTVMLGITLMAFPFVEGKKFNTKSGAPKADATQQTAPESQQPKAQLQGVQA